MKLSILRRSATVIVAVALTLGTGVGAALADVSPGQPANTGSDTLYWSGQGAPVQQMCGSSADSGGVGFINGSSPNNYELWIFGTDGGSVNTQPPPTLTVNGTVYNGAIQTSSTGTDWHIITPYIDPSTITQANPKDQTSTGSAFTSFVVTNVGTGNWKLVISHGCAGPNQAQPLQISKVGAVSYNTDYTWKIEKDLTSAPTIDVNPGGTATASYKVTVTNTGSTNNHIVVNGTIDVINPNNVPVSLAGPGNGVADPALSDGTPCNINSPPTQLQPGDNPIGYSCNLPDGTSTSEINGLTNTATVTWGTQTLSDGSQLTGNSQSYTLQSIPPAQGQPTTTDQCVTPSDPQAPAGTFTQVCASNSPQTFTYQVTYPITNSMIGTCTPFTNTVTLNDANSDSASAGVKVCVGADLTVQKDATPSLTRTYTWTLAKSSSQDGQGNLVTPAGTPVTVNYTVTPSSTYTDSNWQVTGTIRVTNPNDWESVSLTGVTDSIDNGGTCSVTSGDPNGTLAPGGKEVLTYECDYAQAPSPSSFTNTATATWSASAASTDHGSASGTASDDFNGSNTKITTVDKCISVSDTLGGNLGTRCAGDGQGPFTYPVTFNTAGNPDNPGTCTQHPNTATLTTSGTGTTTSASDSVTVCVAEDLGVSKTANPSFTRSYAWKITKTANGGPMVNLVDGGTVNYAVTATQTGVTDSGWMVKGVITVSNPNDFEPITLSALGDQLKSQDPNASCTLDAPGLISSNGTVPAASGGQPGTLSFPYTCSFSGAPGEASDTNKAIAHWNAATAHTPDGSAEGDKDFQWGAPTSRIDQTIHVTDSQGGALGTVTANDSQPFASHTFTYSKTFGAPASGCPVTVNIATITETGQNAQASVTNCTLGALTMGFWQNNNGQKIINNAPSGLAAYIWSFGGASGPFGDMPHGASATNAQVAAYFTSVFSAANASGTGAAMLKAQMLATVLNAFLWKQIGAPANIANVSVNVSQWGAAFGSPSGDITIQQMLQYAAGQWNGGAPYSNSKPTTSLAISAFTAVNQSQITS